MQALLATFFEASLACCGYRKDKLGLPDNLINGDGGTSITKLQI